MRLFNGLALAGLTGVSASVPYEPAEAYILSSSQHNWDHSAPPQLPRQLARDIICQRLAVDTQLSSEIVGDSSLSYISQFGKSEKPLFGASTQTIDPSQLVVLLEGITEDNAKSLRKGLGKEGYKPTFKISDAPSSKANKHLVDVELAGASGSCDITAAINPYDSCWNGMSLVVRYDVAENPETLQSLVDNLSLILKSVSSGTLDATFVLIPEDVRYSKNTYWTTDRPTDLRRRAHDESPISYAPQVETVNKVTTSPGSGGIDLTYSPGAAAEKYNLGCFTSESSCVSATNNCTGHGSCQDKYAIPGRDFEEGDKQCFVCSCMSTKKYPEKAESKHVHWGGAYCQKIDVSSPFWLIATTTILLVGVVTGCIGLLFSVGEEKLPGVIGAGVSRSK